MTWTPRSALTLISDEAGILRWLLLTMSGAELSDYHICMVLSRLNRDACIGSEKMSSREIFRKQSKHLFSSFEVQALLCSPLQLLRLYLMIRAEERTSR